MPASATAPVMPRDPPMIKAVPNVPLCASEGRGGRRRQALDRVEQS